MDQDRNHNAALNAVRSACGIARAVQSDLERVRQITKDDKSPVTVADFAVQAVVALALNEALGESPIVGEEHSQALRTAEQRPVLDAVVEAVSQYRPGISAEQVLRAIDQCDHDASAESYWTLDPIDGTKGFLRGQQYAIALALIDRGRVVLGVMGCPNLPIDQSKPLDQADPNGAMYSAALGRGAFEHRLNGKAGSPRRIHASTFKPSNPIRACESVEAAHSKQDETARVLSELGAAAAPVRLDSQCKYAVVARGQADAYLRLPTKKAYVEKIWDHAAGMIIASEAGAVVSDISGAPLDFTHGRQLEANRGIVCASAGLHGRIIEVIERLGLGATV
ncbi:MAG: 3'(2'),5'-bisphosphate nucleotidase [Phycisphaerales bacterium]|nr:3'(2'),5'-bisphosphate nucleotidase [Phycisphaerales bacterium]MCI0674631.1 3'(2'),5'-bisphosphate nucleotidase [Phycisphaerales bacterium]